MCMYIIVCECCAHSLWTYQDLPRIYVIASVGWFGSNDGIFYNLKKIDKSVINVLGFLLVSKLKIQAKCFLTNYPFLEYDRTKLTFEIF